MNTKKHKIIVTMFWHLISILLIAGLIVPEATFASQRPDISAYTLAVQSPIKPVVDIVNGFDLEKEFIVDKNLSAIAMRDLLKKVAEDIESTDTYKRIIKGTSSANELAAQGPPALCRIVREAVKNAYDSIIDKFDDLVEEGQSRFTGKIIIQAFYEGSDVVINVIDNGRTVEKDEEDMPVVREAAVHRHRQEHAGNANSKKELARIGGTIEWYPLENGTKTEIRVPQEEMPREFYIRDDENILIEKQEKGNDHKLLAKTFRDRWVLVWLSLRMAEALKVQVSKHTLIPELEREIAGIEGMAKMLIDEGIDFEGIEEEHDDGSLTAFYLPLKEGADLKSRLKYYLAPDGEEHIVIPMDDGTNVYIKIEIGDDPSVSGADQPSEKVQHSGYEIYSHPEMIPVETSQHRNSFGYIDMAATIQKTADSCEVKELARRILAGNVIREPGHYLWQYARRNINREERRIAAVFQKNLAASFGKPWLGKKAPNVSHFLLCDYFYFLVNAISGHYVDGRSDPYQNVNFAEIQRGVTFLEEEVKKTTMETVPAEAVKALITRILYANKYEGINPYREGDTIASDQRDELTALIMSIGPAGTLDLFIDNIGPELAANLTFVDYLLRNNIVGKIRVHMKTAPLNISDVWGIKDDLLDPHINTSLEAFGKSKNIAVRAMAGRIKDLMDQGNIELVADEFISYEPDFRVAQEKLNRSLSGSSCAIFVGDYQYVKLMQNRRWPHTEDARVIDRILSYIDTPVGIIRTIKSNIKLGTPVDTPEDGSVGMVQVANSGIYSYPGSAEIETPQAGFFGYKDIGINVQGILKHGADNSEIKQLLQGIASGTSVIQKAEQYMQRELNNEEKRIAGIFEEMLDGHFGKPWRGDGSPEISSFVLVDYMYFLANLLSDHHENGADIYGKSNNKKISEGVNYLAARATMDKGDTTSENIVSLLTDVLYANKYDSTREFKEEELEIASDYRKELADLIMSIGSEGILDLFIDNIGPELSANLQLAEHLVRKNIVGNVRIHIKPAPFVVSDVWGREDDPMKPYLSATLKAFGESNNTDLTELADRLNGFIAGKRITFQRNEFLTYKPDFMEAEAELKSSLDGSSCAIFVGDYLYRKVLGHRRWPHTENADVLNHILNYVDIPVGIIRMVKSDLKLGTPQDTPEDGTVGMVQVANYDIAIEQRVQQLSKLIGSKILHHIDKHPGVNIVATGGFSGSGKTTAASETAEHLKMQGKKVVIVRQDWFLKGFQEVYDILTPYLQNDNVFNKERELFEWDRFSGILEQISNFRDSGGTEGETLELDLDNLYFREEGHKQGRKTLTIDKDTIVLVDGTNLVSGETTRFFDQSFFFEVTFEEQLKRILRRTQKDRAKKVRGKKSKSDTEITRRVELQDRPCGEANKRANLAHYNYLIDNTGIPQLHVINADEPSPAADMAQSTGIRVAVLDWDGTVAKLREGWETIMTYLGASIVEGVVLTDKEWEEILDNVKNDEAWDKDLLTSSGRNLIKRGRLSKEVVLWSRNTVEETKGEPAPHQYRRFYDEAVRLGAKTPAQFYFDYFEKKGDVIDRDNPERYITKYYLEKLYEVRNARLALVDSGAASVEDFLIPGAVDFIKQLMALGITCYIVTGSDEAGVVDEAKRLGFIATGSGEEEAEGSTPDSEADGAHIKVYGYNVEKDVVSKEDVIKTIKENENVEPHEMLVIGDGIVEIKAGKALACRTVLIKSKDNERKFDKLTVLEPEIVVSDPTFEPVEERVTVLTGKIDIDPINLWESDKVLQLEKDIQENGILSNSNFEEDNDVPVLPEPRTGEFTGLYRHKPTGLSIVGKHVKYFDDTKELLDRKNPWHCPTFYETGRKFVYELYLEPNGYRTVKEIVDGNPSNLTGEIRRTVSRAARESFSDDNVLFNHGHLHERNVMVKLDDDGNVLDVKIIDWKFVNKTRLLKKDDMKAELWKARKAIRLFPGMDFRGRNTADIDFRSSRVHWANFRGKDLRKDRFIIANLTGADMADTDLTGVDLTETVLTHANMQRADLKGAVLHSATMVNTDLRDADLRNTDLSEAKITGADLSGADLRGAKWTLTVDLENAIMKDTRFNTGRTAWLQACGMNVVQKDGWCEATSKPAVTIEEEDIPPSTATEKQRAQIFADNINLVQADFDKRISFIALGTSWMKGYRQGSMQHNVLNPLISAIRTHCAGKGIQLIVGSDETVAEEIKTLKERTPGARGIVLAGESTISVVEEYLREMSLENDENMFLAGVDSSNMTENNYIRLMEMLAVALEAFRSGETDETYFREKHPRLGITFKSRRRITFEPDAERMDIDDQRTLYDFQVFA